MYYILTIFYFTNTRSVQNDNNQIDNTAEVSEKKDHEIDTVHNAISIPLQQVSTLAYQPDAQVIPTLFQSFVQVYPIFQPIPMIYPEQKRAKRTCVKCMKASCTGAKTRVKNGEKRICSTFNTILE